MKKRDADMLARIERDAGRGISTKLVDRAFWLDDIDDPAYRPWYQALEAIDKARSAKAMRAAQRTLCALLCGPIPERVGLLLADLLKRYRLTRPANRPATPAYELSPKQLELEWAYETMRNHITDAKIKKGLPAKAVIDEATDKAVRAYPQITRKQLLLRYEGRLGGARRHKAKLRRS
jgi:hypothetical protein